MGWAALGMSAERERERERHTHTATEGSRISPVTARCSDWRPVGTLAAVAQCSKHAPTWSAFSDRYKTYCRGSSAAESRCTVNADCKQVQKASPSAVYALYQP